jgi:hypothetical protein
LRSDGSWSVKFTSSTKLWPRGTLMHQADPVDLIRTARAVIYQRTARGYNTIPTSSMNVCGKMQIRQHSKQLPKEAQIVHSKISQH